MEQSSVEFVAALGGAKVVGLSASGFLKGGGGGNKSSAYRVFFKLADGSGMIGEQRHDEAPLANTFSWQGYSADSPEKILRFLAPSAHFME